jgi:catechol 2,3-dioxygenase-like lactoylglutathione lyase family enzyme
MSRELMGSVDHIGETKTAAPQIKGFHHIAYRCRDAEETYKFYVDLLGLKPAAALSFDKTPSGEDKPFMHLFFEMGDGNFIAFFDAPASASDETFGLKDGIDDYHFAFEVGTMDEVMTFKTRLEEAKVPAFGPIDHTFCHSLYFFDPNGLACEITTKDACHDAYMEEEGGKAAQAITEWSEKTKAIKQARMELFKAAD